MYIIKEKKKEKKKHAFQFTKKEIEGWSSTNSWNGLAVALCHDPEYP
jgi:hypothetical protein